MTIPPNWGRTLADYRARWLHAGGAGSPRHKRPTDQKGNEMKNKYTKSAAELKAQATDWAKLDAMSDAEIDYSDIPKL
ncbi:MAG TPA: hypothetical protein VNX00_15985 [Herbaspirillum sp.]|jgi:hypothetical protein|nr:hypothetical protein [Herbaspirillum sp.]